MRWTSLFVVFYTIDGIGIYRHTNYKISCFALRQTDLLGKGVRHKPIAIDEVKVLLIEPVTTLNTGDVVNERTVSALERI